MASNNILSGKLIGPPFMASVDRTGTRNNREISAYIVRDYYVPTGYSAYILSDKFPAQYATNLATHCPKSSILYDVNNVNQLNDFDVVDISEHGRIFVPYRDASDENILFFTNKCNSNCIMCPDSKGNRQQDLGNRFEYILKLIERIPSDVPHLTITGGEPTLLKWDFIRLLQKCKELFPRTAFLMLSNGRTLCVPEYREAFIKAMPTCLRLAVPIYSDQAEVHDAITRVPGGFHQTYSALRILQNHLELEIRVVIMSKNYQMLPGIAKFITKNLPRTETVSFMGMELLGNAWAKKDELWIDYSVAIPFIDEAVHILMGAGIDAHIYNFPLCSVPRGLWPITEKSITGYKVRYKPECENCRVKPYCGGFFFSTINYNRVIAQPILED